ncbi:hypothetical protein, partial [Serratia marcescens]|uniref:hypothetical protein n=1 Tax=Serratia marcescens TaxID=615 RepID=UPI001954C42D
HNYTGFTNKNSHAHLSSPGFISAITVTDAINTTSPLPIVNMNMNNIRHHGAVLFSNQVDLCDLPPSGRRRPVRSGLPDGPIY